MIDKENTDESLTLTLLQNELEKFIRGFDCDEEKIMQFKKHITDLVINRNSLFRDYYDESELRSVANLRFAEILNKKELDFDQNVVSYFYTGIKQRLWNYMNKQQDMPEYTEEGRADKEVSEREIYQEIEQRLSIDKFNIEEAHKKARKIIPVDNKSFEKRMVGVQLFGEFYRQSYKGRNNGAK